ncbi:DUF58 domain-containing protein [Conchiformibius kuhniae]|uniref:DUF58 domain-containing protein n=1 Tax=Conchiformibius kuhniae TaxID=211502 RepID=A0A8T9MVY7_9NEIS|nr:DUF58 domain-containing protein [Conchiformibius kuhniae]
MSRFERQPHTLHLRESGTLAARHVRLRPTKLCLGLAVLCGAVWVGAVNYQVNVAYAVCFWLAGFIGVAALMTKRQLLGLRWQMDFRGEAFAGETAAITLRGDSTARRGRVFWWSDDGNRAPASWRRAETTGRAPYQGIWHLPLTRRGAFRRSSPLRLYLAATAPFGLFYAEAQIEWETDALAFPAPIAHTPESGHHPAPPEPDAPRHNSSHGEDIAFLKPHLDGTSLQHIAWKTYAKRGELMDKAFEAPAPANDKQTISYRDYPAGTGKDRLAGLLAHRVLQAEHTGQPYVLELPDTRITPQNNQREQCLNALALL